MATTPEQYLDLWREASLAGEPPPMNFETEIVIWLGAVYGSGCPIRLDDLNIDAERHVIHGDFVVPGNPTSCNSDANGAAYVVAVPRDRLPEAPFTVQLYDHDPAAGVPEEQTKVRVDLRSPGSIASAEDLEVERREVTGLPRADLFEPGLVIEDGYPYIVLLNLACSVDIVGPLNAIMWRAIDPDLASGPPTAWTQDANDGLAQAEFNLSTNPARLTVTINGSAVDYNPIPAAEEAVMTCE